MNAMSRIRGAIVTIAWPFRAVTLLSVLAIALGGGRISRGPDPDRYGTTTGKVVECSREAIEVTGGYRSPSITQYRTRARIRYEVDNSILGLQVTEDSPLLHTPLGDSVRIFYEKAHPQHAFLDLPVTLNLRLSLIVSLCFIWFLYEIIRGRIRRDAA
jgi:hypothetical protein